VEPKVMAVARKRLGKHTPTAMNKRETIEEILDMVSSMRSTSYDYTICSETKVGDQFFPKLLV
jgi:hypothetical protein